MISEVAVHGRKNAMCLKCPPPLASTTTMHCVTARGGMKPSGESGGDMAGEERGLMIRKKSQADQATRAWE